MTEATGLALGVLAIEALFQKTTNRKRYAESNGHVTDDVSTWLQQVKFVTPICLESNISKNGWR